MPSLQDLDQDVLTQIFEELRPVHRLSWLSQTCRWLRDASAPVLFKYAGHGLNEKILKRPEKFFLPRAFWPYVRRIAFWCECRNPVDPLLTTDEDLLCPFVNHRVVKEALRHMPGLIRLRLHTGNLLKHGHGISWRRMKFFLSLPTLRELRVVDLCVSPILPDRPRVKTLAPISTFKYDLRDYRAPSKLLTEERALTLLLIALNSTLESLFLPAESTPILALSSLPWPRLRELRIFGHRWSIPHKPLISLLSNLPHLHTIVFSLSDPEDQSEDARAIWPVGCDVVFPWPELQHLTLSHPSTKDAVYAHLPPTLQTLALRSWTHYCVRRSIQKRVHPHLPPMFLPGTASTIRQVLRDVSIPELRAFELEYRVDTDDLLLLEDVVSRFPKLDTIELHRYPLDGVQDVPLYEIANILHSLAQLRIAKLNLDFQHMRPGSVFYSDDPTIPSPPHGREATPSEMLRSCALIFARVCPSLEEVWLLFNHERFLIWCCYLIVRRRDGDNVQVDIMEQDDVFYTPRR